MNKKIKEIINLTKLKIYDSDCSASIYSNLYISQYQKDLNDKKL